MIIEYCLIAECVIFDFNKSVSEHLKYGWELYGSPFSSGNLKCQALIKRSK